MVDEMSPDLSSQVDQLQQTVAVLPANVSKLTERVGALRSRNKTRSHGPLPEKGE